MATDGGEQRVAPGRYANEATAWAGQMNERPLCCRGCTVFDPYTAQRLVICGPFIWSLIGRSPVHLLLICIFRCITTGRIFECFFFQISNFKKLTQILQISHIFKFPKFSNFPNFPNFPNFQISQIFKFPKFSNFPNYLNFKIFKN